MLRVRRRRLVRSLISLTAVGASIGAVVTATGVAAAAPAPALRVDTVTTGLTTPWEVVVAPDGTILTDERAGAFVAVLPGGVRKQVRADLSRLFVTRAAGLLGMSLDANFAQNRRLYTCQSELTGTGPGIAVPQALLGLPVQWPNTGQVNNIVAWTVSSDWSRLTRERTILTGIPVNAAGREAGCSVTTAPDGTLWIGTGDNGIATMAQDPRSLGGKTLRITTNGSPAAGNPKPSSPIYTLGHRNVQNIAFDAAGRAYSIEQGTDTDDELNLLRAGGNYGYRPDGDVPLYDESSPMTDPRVAGAIPAVWSSGRPTIATPSITFLPTSGWGQWNGAVVISALKGKRLVLAKLSDDGRRVVRTAEVLKGEFGRLRGSVVAADGSLLVLTNNGKGGDKILRVRPASS